MGSCYASKSLWIGGDWGDTAAKENVVKKMPTGTEKRKSVKNWWNLNKVYIDLIVLYQY